MKFKRQAKRSTDAAEHPYTKVKTTDIWLYAVTFVLVIVNSVVTIGSIEYLSAKRNIRDANRLADNYAQNIKDSLLISLNDAEKISDSQLKNEITQISRQSFKNYLAKISPGQLAQVAIISQDGSTLASNFEESSSQSVFTSKVILDELQQKTGTLSSSDKIRKVDLEIEQQHLRTQVIPWKNNELDLSGFLVVAVPRTQLLLDSTATIKNPLRKYSIYWLPAVGLILLTCVEAILLSDKSKQLQGNRIVPEQKAIPESDIDSEQDMASAFSELLEADALRTISSEPYVLLASMSHELRSPLNAILGFAQIMVQELSLTQSNRENIAIINRSGERLLSIINDVVDLAKIETERLTLEDNNLDFSAWLDNLEQNLKFQAGDRGWEFSLIKHGELPQYICVDERRLRQIIRNLIDYCLKDPPLQNTITLSVRASQIQENNQTDSPNSNNKYDICFEVKNDNCSVTSEELDTIFDPLVMVKQADKPSAGSSLNLPISRKLSQLMEGDLTVKAIEPSGIVFNLRIKAESITAGKLPPQPMVRRVIGLESDKIEYRILIVDDSRTSRKIMSQLLSSVGFKIEEAANGKEAIDIWLRWQPHMIWMDLKMPVMNGCEATERIRAYSSKTHIPIVALSASTLEEEKSWIKAAGCDDFVGKPFSEDIIFDKIAQHLGIRYIYEPVNSTNSNHFTVEADALGMMPSQWIEQVEEAAIQLDRDLLTQLLEKIPSERAELKNALQEQVNNFDFDRILDLTINRHNN